MLVGISQAQIVLTQPDAAGYCDWNWSSTWVYVPYNYCVQGGTYLDANGCYFPIGTNLEVKGTSNTLGSHNYVWRHCTLPMWFSDTTVVPNSFIRLSGAKYEAVLEFNISGLLGSGGVTPDNFQSAELGNLEVITSLGNTDIEICLGDLHDNCEDGTITEGESGTFISYLCTTRPPVGTIFNNIDVTDAVYNDLFGSGSGEDYTGFLFCNEYPYNGEFRVVFNRDSPTLTISIDQPVPSISTYCILFLFGCFSFYAIIRLKKDYFSQPTE